MSSMRARARLAAANPVCEEFAAANVPARWSEELLANIVSQPTDPSPQPLQRSRRRRLASAAAAAAAVIAALGAPALGFDHAIVDFFAAEPAAGNVRLQFAKMERAAGDSGPGVIASEARRIILFRTASGERELTLAPTEDGSFCWSIAGFSGGCQTILSVRGSMKSGEHEPVRIGLVFTDIPAPTMPQQPVLIGGNLRADGSARLQVEFEDGESTGIPFVWVSQPIDAGFFLYELPRERWAEGRRPVALSLQAADGALLSRVTFSVAASIEEHEAGAPRRP